MLHLLKKIKGYFISRQRRNEETKNNEYWQLCDENDLPTQIRLKVNHIYEEKLGEFIPNLNQYNDSIVKFLKHRFTRFLYEIDDSIIDPDQGLVLLRQNYLFRYSHLLMEDPWGKMQPRPSKDKFLNRVNNVKKVESGIFIRFDWTNYYHFLIDTVPQIELCDEIGLDKDIPIIVPSYYAKHGFVREYFEKIKPLTRKLIVMEQGQYLEVKKLYIVKDVFFCNTVIGYAKNVLPDDRTIRPKKIFIKRHKNAGRTLSNLEEIEDVLLKRGFTVIEPGDYSMVEQTNLFSDAELIVSIHGAGVTNIVFSKAQSLKLIEIFKGGTEFPDHYKNLSKIFGYSYRRIEADKPITATGEFALNDFNNFYLNPTILEEVLDS